MKKIILAVSIISVFLFTGCSKNENINETITETHEENVSSGDLEIIETPSDEKLLEDFKSKVTVVENKKEFFDESGDLLYYIQHDYLETNTDEENIKKIVANYLKEEITEENMQIEHEDVVRLYPEDIYYDTSTYVIADVHNGIINIAELGDWWWGSPHSYPYFSCKNYILETGEEYAFPDEIKEDIYEKATNEFLEIAKNNDYAGLLGDYFDNNGNWSKFLTYDEVTNKNILTDEALFRTVVYEELQRASFELSDENIIFHIDAAYSLATWADKASYSLVEIPNEWNL